jgi:hypothetical protein
LSEWWWWSRIIMPEFEDEREREKRVSERVDLWREREHVNPTGREVISSQ